MLLLRFRVFKTKHIYPAPFLALKLCKTLNINKKKLVDISKWLVKLYIILHYWLQCHGNSYEISMTSQNWYKFSYFSFIKITVCHHLWCFYNNKMHCKWGNMPILKLQKIYLKKDDTYVRCKFKLSTIEHLSGIEAIFRNDSV